MDVTKEEKARGIHIITSMTLADFFSVIDKKIDELDEKVALYIQECTDDYHECKLATPHEIETAIELHKTYASSLRGVLLDLKEICKSNLNKNYMVPTLIVEAYMEISRKMTTLKYVKMPPSHVRISA